MSGIISQNRIKPLFSVLKALERQKVDYFSLDIEGAEHVALNTIPWDHLKDVTLLSVEVNHAGDIFPGSHFLHFLQPKDLDSWAWLHMHDHRNLPKKCASAK